MSAIEHLSAAEKQRLVEFQENVGGAVISTIRAQFNGKAMPANLEKLVSAAEQLEKLGAGKNLLKGLFNGPASAYYTLKGVDGVAQIARRAANGNDLMLALYLPGDKLEKTDPALLRKCQLDNLAALVEARLMLP